MFDRVLKTLVSCDQSDTNASKQATKRSKATIKTMN